MFHNINLINITFNTHREILHYQLNVEIDKSATLSVHYKCYISQVPVSHNTSFFSAIVKDSLHNSETANSDKLQEQLNKFYMA